MSVDPLIVTAVLDRDTTARLEALRREHFPPERLVVGAHLTLFHALPGEQLDAVRRDLRAVAPGAPLPGTVAGVQPLGRGVAYRVAVDGLDAMHAELRRRWAAWLTRQDEQPLRPHVTVQNKVAPGTAKALLAALERDFAPWPTRVEALGLWWYRGGPWEPAATVPFAEAG